MSSADLFDLGKPVIRVELDGDPVAKGRPRFSSKSGTAYTPAKTQRYEQRLAWAAQVTMKGRPLLESALSVTIHVYKDIPKSWSKKKRADAVAGALRPTGKPDADNFAKCMDALNLIVWRDDSQVVDLTVRKWYSERPRLIFLISEA